MGAHLTVNAATDDVTRIVLDATGGEGVDVVCEMSGVPSALHQAFATVRMGGRVQLLGIPRGAVPIDFATEIIFKGITIYGVIGRDDQTGTRCGGSSPAACSIAPGHHPPVPARPHRRGARRHPVGDAGKVILEIA
jgi:threonine 3-dehydrogenase